MDLFELEAQFCGNVPAEGGAEEAGAEVVAAIGRVAEHNCEIFRDVMEEDVERVHAADDGFGLENAVVKDMALVRGVSECEVLRVASAEELQGHFHEFFAGKFATWEIVKDHLAMFLIQSSAFCDAGYIAVLKF